MKSECLLVFMIWTGCITVEQPENPLAIDNDADGYTEFDGDCDDLNPLAFPSAAQNESDSECLTDLMVNQFMQRYLEITSNEY